MRRREFIAGIGGATAWPFVARALRSKLPVVGLLNGVSFAGPYAAPVVAIAKTIGIVETDAVAAIAGVEAPMAMITAAWPRTRSFALPQNQLPADPP
jgi:hypothetical protein